MSNVHWRGSNSYRREVTLTVWRGLIAAAFTPFGTDGTLKLDVVNPIVERLLGEGVTGLFLVGTTGEFSSLTQRERVEVAEAYVTAVAGRVPVIVHVGDPSVQCSRELALHAASCGADGIAAVPPFYEKLENEELLVDWLAGIAEAVPALPFFYYHIPLLTGVHIDPIDFLGIATERLPTLAGVKYSDSDLANLQACLETYSNRLTFLFGIDQMLLSAIILGIQAAVGSTYNFAAPLYVRMWRAAEVGDWDSARSLQAQAVRLVRLCTKYGRPAAFKAAMQLVGPDCGPPRLPARALSETSFREFRSALAEIGIGTL
jgi:N-acetylneuraminate lyase